MRRNDRAVNDLDMIKNLVSKCQVVRIAMCKDNVPYLVPLNYGYEFNEDELILYCHCANEGKKIDILSENLEITSLFSFNHKFFLGQNPDSPQRSGKRPCFPALLRCAGGSPGRGDGRSSTAPQGIFPAPPGSPGIH